MADPTASLRPSRRSSPGVRSAPGRGAGRRAAAASFGALLEQVLRMRSTPAHKSETQATQAVVGNANLQQVVEAVNAAEITLQTVVAVRDRMISAYQEIMRMPM